MATRFSFDRSMDLFAGKKIEQEVTEEREPMLGRRLHFLCLFLFRKSFSRRRVGVYRRTTTRVNERFARAAMIRAAGVGFRHSQINHHTVRPQCHSLGDGKFQSVDRRDLAVVLGQPRRLNRETAVAFFRTIVVVELTWQVHLRAPIKCSCIA